MNVPIKIILIALGVLAGMTGIGVGVLYSKFQGPSGSILSPFLLISVAILVFSCAYAYSVFLKGKK